MIRIQRIKMIKVKTKTSRIPQASKIPRQKIKQMTKIAAKQKTLIQILNQNSPQITPQETNKRQKQTRLKSSKVKRLIRQQMANSRHTMELAPMVTSPMANLTRMNPLKEIQESLKLLKQTIKPIKDSLLTIKWQMRSQNLSLLKRRRKSSKPWSSTQAVATPKSWKVER